MHADLLAAQREEFAERLQIVGPAVGESPRVLWDRLWPELRNPFDRVTLSVGGVEVVTIDHQKEKIA
ncbi:MAG: hypothetical protein ABII82_19035 [Verrucomicrobiota bacterium]